MALAKLIEPALLGTAFAASIEAWRRKRALLRPPGEDVLSVVNGGDGASVGVGRDLVNVNVLSRIGGDGLQYSVVQSLVEAVLVDTSVSVEVTMVLKDVLVFVETSNVVVVKMVSTLVEVLVTTSADVDVVTYSVAVYSTVVWVSTSTVTVLTRVEPTWSTLVFSIVQIEAGATSVVVPTAH